MLGYQKRVCDKQLKTCIFDLFSQKLIIECWVQLKAIHTNCQTVKKRDLAEKDEENNCESELNCKTQNAKKYQQVVKMGQITNYM